MAVAWLPQLGSPSPESTGWRRSSARVVELPDLVVTTAWLNGMPGARFDLGGETTAVSLVVEDGRITRIYAIRNPQKLGWLGKVAELQR